MGSLQAHEDRMNRTIEKSEEHAFQARSKGRSRGQNCDGRSNAARGCGPGRTWSSDTRRCYNCNRIGHLARDCREKVNQAEFATEESAEEGEDYLFMATTEGEQEEHSTWLINSCCSRHCRELITKLREKDRELATANRKNAELEKKVRLMAAENQIRKMVEVLGEIQSQYGELELGVAGNYRGLKAAGCCCCFPVRLPLCSALHDTGDWSTAFILFCPEWRLPILVPNKKPCSLFNLKHILPLSSSPPREMEALTEECRAKSLLSYRLKQAVDKQVVRLQEARSEVEKQAREIYHYKKSDFLRRH